MGRNILRISVKHNQPQCVYVYTLMCFVHVSGSAKCLSLLQDLKQSSSLKMSSSATTYFSNGTPGGSASSGPLGYWGNQNYHFYQHYAYQNGGGIVQAQFPYQQDQSTMESAETLYQPQETENPSTQVPAEDQNTVSVIDPRTKYPTNLPSISYTIVGFNQEQRARKPTSSPSSLQIGLDTRTADESFTNRYNLNSSSNSSMFQNHYEQINQELRSPPPEVRSIHIASSPSPRRADNDATFPTIGQESAVEVKKEPTSPILGMLLNRPSVPKVSPSALPPASQSAGYQDFYSPTGSASTTVPEYTNKDGSLEERRMALRHQYSIDAGTSASSRTNETEDLPSRQTFGNISPPPEQADFSPSRLENRKLPLEYMQPVIPYGDDGRDGAKLTSHIQHTNFYPWMKSYAGKFLHLLRPSFLECEYLLS